MGYEIELKTFGQFLNIKTGYDEYKQFFNTQKRRTGSYFGLQNRGQLINCDDFVNKIKALFAGDAPNLFLARRIAEYAIEGLECLGAQVLLIEQVVFNKNQMDILEGAIKAIREVLVQHSAGSTKFARKVYVAPDNIGE